MTPRSRWRRRAIALWAGLTAALGAAALVEYIRVEEHFALALTATTVIALLIGVAGTRRLRAHNPKPLITVRDLRRR